MQTQAVVPSIVLVSPQDVQFQTNQGQKKSTNFCSTIICCVKTSTETGEQVIKWRAEESSEEIVMSPRRKIVIEEVGGIQILRPLKENEKIKDDLRKETLEMYYDGLVERYDAATVATAALWKKIDFVELHRTGKSLRLTHMVELQEG